MRAPRARGEGACSASANARDSFSVENSRILDVFVLFFVRRLRNDFQPTKLHLKRPYLHIDLSKPCLDLYKYEQRTNDRREKDKIRIHRVVPPRPRLTGAKGL